MESRRTRALYDRFPPLLKSASASAFGWAKRRRRYSGAHSDWLRFFNEAAGWPEERLRSYQDEKLRDLVTHAAAHVPFHQRRFRALGVDPADVRDVESLKGLPLLEKEDVRRAGDDLISRAHMDTKINRYPTSGSTGTPLVIPHTDFLEQMEWAFMEARFLPVEAGTEPYSSFTGLELILPGRTRPPFWVDNWANRQRMYSVFHLSDANLLHYVRALDSRYSAFYLGYPSAMYTIADFMLRKGLRLRRPPADVLCSSEELQPQYESAIKGAFGSRIRNRYGQNEFVASITLYDCGHMHYDMDYSIVEFIPLAEEEDGSILAEVVGTNIHALSWPLFRYRTGDLVVYHPEDRCDAGRPGKVIRRVQGRTGRYFTLPNGSRVTNISVIAKKCTNVRLMQVVQRRRGEIVIRVVRGDAFSDSDEARIFSEFRRKLGREVGIRIDYVGDIERTSRGKFMSIVNETETAW